MSEEEVKKLIDSPQSVMLRLREAFAKKNGVATVTEPSCPFFSNEEIASDSCYPVGYSVRPISEQFVELVRHFPQLEPRRKLTDIEAPPLPEGAEGWFVVPNYVRIGATYNEALEKVLKRLGKSLNLDIRCRGWLRKKLDERHIMLEPRTL